MINVPITFDEAYQFIKLYDTLRDMDFELTESQQNVFEKIQKITRTNTMTEQISIPFSWDDLCDTISIMRMESRRSR